MPRILTTILFLLLALPLALIQPVLAQQASPDARPETHVLRTVSVAGHGESRSAPDVAVITIGVNSIAATAPEALDANSQAMKALMALLETSGVDKRDMTTSNFSVGPRYDYNQTDGQPPKVTGYEVNNMVQATIRKLETLGTVLDKAVTAGGNQVNGVSFAVSKPDAALDEARKAAFADARRKAELYAAAGGFQLGEIISVNEGASGWQPPVVMAKAMRAGAPDAVPVAQGDQTLSIDVSIVWSIKG